MLSAAFRFTLDIDGSGRDLRKEFALMNDHLQNVGCFDVENWPEHYAGVVMRFTVSGRRKRVPRRVISLTRIGSGQLIF